MIRISRSENGRASFHLDGDASAALVDRDWLPTGDGPVHAPYIAADGDILYRGRYVSSDMTDPTVHIGAWICSLVDEIVGLVREIASDGVQVTGRGVSAEAVRRRLGNPSTPSLSSPRAVIEMTGEPDEVRAATESVADGGLIVLAGTSDPPIEINLYKDVHRRGLRLVGAPWLGAIRTPGSDRERDLPSPTAVRVGEPVPPAAWYRVTL